MAKDRELVESLLEGFQSLQYRDEDELNRLQNRGRMIIRRSFGEDSDYYQRFIRLEFHPMVYPTTDTARSEVWRSGQREALNLTKTMLEELSLAEPEIAIDGSFAGEGTKSDRIFLVHGHDEAMKLAVARALDQLKLRPVILHEQPNKGRTLIEKFTDYSDVGYAVILLSPDDAGYPKDGDPENARPRARQNVILELGYFIGKLGRENVLAVYRQSEGFEFPSDYSGVLYTSFDDGRWQLDLVRELKACGYDISADDLI